MTQMRDIKEILIRIALTTFGVFIPLAFFNAVLGTREPGLRKTVKEYLAEQGYKPAYIPSATARLNNDRLFYPISSLPDTLTYYCDEGLGLITYRSDAFGFRNHSKAWGYSDKRDLTIMLVGDSFVHGACLPDESTIASTIGHSIDARIINLGFGGNTPYEYIATIKSIVEPLAETNTKNRSIVLLFFYINDLVPEDIGRIDRAFSPKKILKKHAEGESVFMPTKEYTRKLSMLIDANFPLTVNEILTELIKKNRSIQTNPYYKTFSLYHIRNYIRSMHAARGECKTINHCITPSYLAIAALRKSCTGNCTPFVIYIPNSPAWSSTKYSNEYKNLLRRRAEKMSIEFVDGSQSINVNDETLYMPNGPHLSAKGASALANQIVKSISKEK